VKKNSPGKEIAHALGREKSWLKCDFKNEMWTTQGRVRSDRA
jgi:hypothetical protein